jgi:hypothetical protein
MRPILPGESDPFLGVRDEIPGVAIKCTVVAVDTRNGTVTLRLGGSLGQYPDVKIPLMQFSLNRTKSSWGRFMPQIGDLVTAVQDLDGDLHILNWECLNYRQIADADAEEQFIFRELKEGEFEWRSSGAATIFGSELGELRLTGGPVSVTLSKDQLEAVYDAPLHRAIAGGCESRFGEVRRKLLPTDVEESSILGGTLAESQTVVARSTGLVDTRLADVTLGDVAADFAPYTPALGPVGLPLRAQARLYDDLGATELFSFAVDNTGNVAWTQAATAVALGLKIAALASPLSVQFRDIELQPSLTLKFGSSASTEPFVLGTQLNAFLQSLVDTLKSAVVATATGPASFNPATIAALESLKTTYLNSNLILSDFIFGSKLPTPGAG